ncbi:hypothetical protein A9Q84_00905 [Halobacteriovorax marinus]|uniref:Methyltransferase type 11 domain-containing protein n=1 Tax=Halobacteriovorax marinus TaxID=97084 RepID=A0A1Y5FBP8_9BACT|nr:hypothetical protein A9Q84_00905 [Halobacteriovorax marinus]
MKKTQPVDIHALYLASVQDPMSDIERISNIYSEIFQKQAKSFREDFSGTFALSCCWVQSDIERSAIAIDIDHETVEYGKKNYLANMNESEQGRLQAIEGNCIVETEAVDVIATFNFSYCLLHKRSELLDYFKKCHTSLNDNGMMIMDNFGGSDSEIPEVQERDIEHADHLGPFIFEFERKSFNPIDRLAHYGIHFKFPDGREVMNAYTYHFRMWSLTELKDLLEEAGFSKSHVYWEKCDKDGFGNGEFYQTLEEENSVNWNAYIVGVK